MINNDELFRLLNSSVFGKTMENVKKHRDARLLTIEKTSHNQIITQQGGFQFIY